MKLNVKEYFKISAIYTLVGAVPSVLQLLVQPLIEGEDKLGAVDFSHLAITETITSFAFVFTLFSMGNAVSRFYYDFINDNNGYKRLVSSVYNSILLRGLILIITAFIFRNQIGYLFSQNELRNFSSYGFAAIVIGINRSIVATAGALYRNEKNIKLFVIINLALTILRTGLQVIGVLYYDMSFLGYVYGTVIGSSVTSVAVLVMSYMKTGFIHDRKIMKSVNLFAWPLFQYGVIAWGLTFADRYFLEQMPEQLGIYNTAVSFAIGIQIILQGLQGAVQPELFRFMKEGISKHVEEIKKMSNLFLLQSQGIIILSIIPAILFLLVFYETDVKLASGIISVIFIRQIMVSQYNMFSTPIYFLKKTRIFLYMNLVVLASNLILNFILIPRWNMYGAIIAALIANLLQVVLMYFYQEKIIPVKWNINKTIWFPLATCIIVCILQILQEHFSLNPLVGAVVINVFFCCGVFYLYKKELVQLWEKYKPLRKM